MQTINEVIINRCRMLASQVQPVENGIGCTMLNATDSSQTVALDQHPYGIKKCMPIRSQGFKERAFIKTKGLLTGCAVIPSRNVAMDFDISNMGLSKVSTRSVIAPLLSVLHRASSELARCAL